MSTDCQRVYNFYVNSGLTPGWTYSSSNGCTSDSSITTSYSYYYGYYQVTGINLYGKGMTSIDGPTLGLLSNLQVLVVSNNKLYSIPNQVCQLQNLYYFYADNNCIQQVPSCASVYFYGTIYTTSITLLSNPMSYIPKTLLFYKATQFSYYMDPKCGWSGVVNYEYYQVPDCKSLSSLISIFTLSSNCCSDKGITCVNDNSIVAKQRIVSVDISGNKLTNAQFSQFNFGYSAWLEMMTSFSANNNALTSVPSNLCGISNINIVYLNGNCITTNAVACNSQTTLLQITAYNNSVKSI